MRLSVTLVKLDPNHFITVTLIWIIGIVLDPFINSLAAVLQQVDQLEVITVNSVRNMDFKTIDESPIIKRVSVKLFDCRLRQKSFPHFRIGNTRCKDSRRPNLRDTGATIRVIDFSRLVNARLMSSESFLLRLLHRALSFLRAFKTKNLFHFLAP